jgi:hypothetical protein
VRPNAAGQVVETKEEGSMTVRSMTVRSSLIVFLLAGTGWLVAATSRSPSTGANCGRLDVDWSVEHGDSTYRLRGRYSIASLSGHFMTSISSDAEPDATAVSLCVPEGLYRVTLEPGYTLERVEADAVAGVPAWLVSPNPVVVTAKQGQPASMSLSLVDLPGMAAEPEATCMNGS